MGMIKKGVETANRTSFAGAPTAIMEAAKYSSAVQVAKKGFGGVSEAGIQELERKRDTAQEIVKMNKKAEIAKKSAQGRGLLASSRTGEM